VSLFRVEIRFLGLEATMLLSRKLSLALIGAAMYVSAQMPDFTPPTPLLAAILHGDNAGVERLLAGGANPNEGRFLGASPLIVALMQKNATAARALMEKGADVKITDPAGSTSLMWAVTTETGDAELVEELLQRGVDPNAANKAGETALQWALRRGYTPAVGSLKRHGASDAALIKSSVEKAVALLQKSGPEFVKVSGCTSCHHQSLPQMAYAAARERGIAVDAQVSDKQVKAVLGMFQPYTEQMQQGKENIPDPALSVTYSLLGLAAEGHPSDATTEAMAHLVSVQQNEDGSFRVFPARPPIESNAISATALSLRALQIYGKDPEPQVERAREWLRHAVPHTTEEKAMRLLGLNWSKAGAADLRAAAQLLLAGQSADGGWSQLPNVESDAYATGQALYALHVAGQANATDSAYERGVTFLLRTQRPDGSWLVRTRAFPFQPYKESGFPHGKDQWISASGTSWAVMALSPAVPRAQDQQLSE
jgi:hypothetical protein